MTGTLRPMDLQRAVAVAQLLAMPDPPEMNRGGHRRGHRLTLRGARYRLRGIWWRGLHVWAEHRIQASEGPAEGWKSAARHDVRMQLVR